MTYEDHELEAYTYIDGGSAIGGISYEYEQMEYESPTYSPAPEEEKTGCNSCKAAPSVNRVPGIQHTSKIFPPSELERVDHMETVYTAKKTNKFPALILAVIGLILFNA